MNTDDLKKPPPMAERPKCPNCDTPLKPHMDYDSVRVELPNGGFTYERQNHHWLGTYLGYGNFCSLKCCERFANAAYTAGYRINPA